jgi:hypothetical protein
MREHTDDKGLWYILEFKYLTPSEPQAEIEIRDGGTVMVNRGKNSGRIYSIWAREAEGSKPVHVVQLRSNVRNALEVLEKQADQDDFGSLQRVRIIEELVPVALKPSLSDRTATVWTGSLVC